MNIKNFFIGSALALSLAGCASSSVPGLTSSKIAGSSCATAGAALSALALKGTPSQDALALHYAGIITPACSSTSPALAQSAAVQTAFAELAKLAAPYLAKTTTTSTGATIP